jgi:hypothetical protein
LPTNPTSCHWQDGISEEKKLSVENVCCSGESNPGRLLGRQQASPLAHCSANFIASRIHRNRCGCVYVLYLTTTRVGSPPVCSIELRCITPSQYRLISTYSNMQWSNEADKRHRSLGSCRKSVHSTTDAQTIGGESPNYKQAVVCSDVECGRGKDVWDSHSVDLARSGPSVDPKGDIYCRESCQNE